MIARELFRRKTLSLILEVDDATGEVTWHYQYRFREFGSVVSVGRSAPFPCDPLEAAPAGYSWEPLPRHRLADAPAAAHKAAGALGASSAGGQLSLFQRGARAALARGGAGRGRGKSRARRPAP
jgi:hypothetical protein